MKIAYFDCFSGASGDMILGALIDAGLDFRRLESELEKLKMSGYKLAAEKTTRKGISGTKFSVFADDSHPERHLSDIERIIDKSDLALDIKTGAKEIFRAIAEVEAKIHNAKSGHVHFHEVGGVDSTIDVVGSLLAISMLGIEEIYTSKIPVGAGFVKCDHSPLPLPAPATLEFLKSVPVYESDIDKELVTPTGIAILKHISKSFGRTPRMKIDSIGYGAGNRELTIPNFLRVWIGSTESEGDYEKDEAILIETNIDNTSPEVIGYAMEKLLLGGALDVFMTPIFMKKNRPAALLSVLAAPDKLDDVLTVIFAETNSIGVRFQRLERRKLPSKSFTVETPFGPVKVKVCRLDREKKSISPEYEDCREIAASRGIPFREVYNTAHAAALKIISDKK